MENGTAKLVLAICLSAVALALTIHSLLTKPDVDIREQSVTTENTAFLYKPYKEEYSDKVNHLYIISGLEAFAQKHRGVLQDLRSYRSRECGTISSVSPLDCEACDLFVTAAKTLVQSGGTQEDIVALARKTCIELKVEDERVCNAIVLQFKVKYRSLANNQFATMYMCSKVVKQSVYLNDT